MYGSGIASGMPDLILTPLSLTELRLNIDGPSAAWVNASNGVGGCPARGLVCCGAAVDGDIVETIPAVLFDFKTVPKLAPFCTACLMDSI